MNTVLSENAFPSGQVFQLVQGDITYETTEAIVNAANAYLRHGAGVAGAIVRQGGSVIQEESDAWVREHGTVHHNRPAWTSGGNLPCKYVIHAVGPMWGEGDERAKLVAAVTGCLRAAQQLDLVSLAMPAISTGIFGFPRESAAQAIFSAVQEYFMGDPDSTLMQVRLVLYDQPTLAVFIKAWNDHFHS